MGTEEQLLAESIRTTISRTSDVLWRLLPLQPRSIEEAEEDPSEELIDLDGELSDHLKKLYRDVAILAERLQLPLLCRKISQTFNEHKDTLTHTSNHYDEYMDCPSFTDIRSIFASIDVMIDGKDISSVAVLQNILENTRKILVDAGIPVPTTEKEIYAAVGKVLNYAFHDVVPQYRLPRPLKPYKPEFAIKSVKSLVEYKFARSEHDLKIKVDELYTDTRGYVSDSGYSTFFAVIYCHDQYAHIEKVKREFQTSDVGPHWRIILVHGGGAAQQVSDTPPVKTSAARASPKKQK